MKNGLERFVVEGHRWIEDHRLGVVAPSEVSKTLSSAGMRCAAPDDDVDVLIVDLPASGSRLTGEHLVLLERLVQAAQRKLRVLVLDRPIPLGGMQLEGPTVELRQEGLCQPVPLPLRHGLTVGELARWFVGVGALDVDLDIIRCMGWDRLMGPHPLPSFEHPAWQLPELFCGLGIVAAATQCAWSPGLDGSGVALSWPGADGARLLQLVRMGSVDADLHGVDFHAHPNGLGIRLLEPHSVDAVKVGLVVLEGLTREHQARSSAPLWRVEDGVPQIDRVSGSPELRLALTARIRPSELAEAWGPAITQFDEERQAALLY